MSSLEKGQEGPGVEVCITEHRYSPRWHLGAVSCENGPFSSGHHQTQCPLLHNVVVGFLFVCFVFGCTQGLNPGPQQ